MQSYGYLMGGSEAGGHYVELLETKFHDLLRLLLAQVEVDERWYRDQYRDVDDAVRAGLLRSAKEHYSSAGYFENRLPRPINVDEAWYLAEYADVAAAIRAGAFDSASQHFERDGFKEGRLPSQAWSLLGKAA